MLTEVVSQEGSSSAQRRSILRIGGPIQYWYPSRIQLLVPHGFVWVESQILQLTDVATMCVSTE